MSDKEKQKAKERKQIWAVLSILLGVLNQFMTGDTSNLLVFAAGAFGTAILPYLVAVILGLNKRFGLILGLLVMGLFALFVFRNILKHSGFA